MIWLVALCGGLGAVARFGLDAWLRSRWPVLPATVVVNLLGSFLLGVLVESHARTLVGDPSLALAGVGFCGGFTTLSTAAVEVVRLVRAGRASAALGLLLGGAALCLAAAILGAWLARAL